MKELDQQINNDSNHHPLGVVTDDQICRYSRMPKASCQMVNNLSRRATLAARPCGKAGIGEPTIWSWTWSPAPCLAGCAEISIQTARNNKNRHWPRDLKAQDWLDPMVWLSWSCPPPAQLMLRLTVRWLRYSDPKTIHDNVRGWDRLLPSPALKSEDDIYRTENFPLHFFYSNGCSFLN